MNPGLVISLNMDRDATVLSVGLLLWWNYLKDFDSVRLSGSVAPKLEYQVGAGLWRKDRCNLHPTFNLLLAFVSSFPNFQFLISSLSSLPNFYFPISSFKP